MVVKLLAMQVWPESKFEMNHLVEKLVTLPWFLSSLPLFSRLDLGSPNELNADHNRISRNLLAVGSTVDPTTLPGYFFNATDCLFLFNNGIVAIVKTFTFNKETKKIERGPVYNFTLDSEPSGHSATCANLTSDAPETTATLTYSGGKISESQITNVVLTLKMKVNKAGKYWIGSGGSEIALKSSISDLEKTLKLRDAEITATTGFSFSCSKLRLRSPPATNDTLAQIDLYINRFQIQPFTTGKPWKIFADSFDCSTWFTISLWVGLFVTILFGGIISLGIFMLFEIKTMDRFENPKGKTITVATGD